MFSKIAEIKSIREDISRLSERETELTKPILTDLSFIETLYEWFKEIVSSGPKRYRSIQQKEFIFIILFMYSPGTLAGGKMKSGLREELGKSIGVKTASAISNKINEIVFMYKLYKYFRSDLNRIYTEILNRIKLHDNKANVTY